MEPFKKVVNLGNTQIGEREYQVYAEITWDGKRLSIHGVEGPTRGGNAMGSAGQISMNPPVIENLAPGWTRTMLRDFWKNWEKWHLNDLQAACEHQRSRGETWTTHPNAICPDCGYSLGSKWLYMEVPEDVLQWFNDLPESLRNPAWV